jgi:Uncharacterised protein family (UPF0158)
MDEAADPRIPIRIALNSGSGAGVVEALAGVELSDIAQLSGESLLLALSQGVEGAKPLAETCSKALRDRGFDGDDVLAEQLDVAVGRKSPEALKTVAVDLEELSWILDGEGEGRVDLKTGEVWSDSAIEYAEESGEGLEDEGDEDRWLYVYPEGSQEAYRDMEDFISGVEDYERADRLSIAVSGRGAFRRFKDVLGRWPDEEERFYRFSEERRRARARSWLRSAGVLSVPSALEKRG